MKKLFHLTAIILSALLAATSCTQDISEDSTKVKGLTSITIGLPATRTSLGEKVGENYPTYWSENDVIVANGATSTSLTLGADRTSATFSFENSTITPPCNITYPYTEGSLCAENRPTVVFNAEQSYVAETFGVGDAPMCGYYKSGERTVLKHLAGILRFAIKGSATLAKIEIIANEGVASAGEFDVDCQTGAIAAIEGKTTNKITYTINETLSTEEAKAFHVAVPHGNLGACKVILTDNGGLTMTLQLNATNIKAGIVREFKEFTYKAGASFALEGFEIEEDEFIIDYPTPTGPANNEIWYTSTDGNIVTPNSATDFGANIVSNTYKDDKGIIKFDKDITSIGESAFVECSNLASITIPNSVTSIGVGAFLCCESLTNITMSSSITKIGESAFAECTKLASITIPNNVTEIGAGAFANCSSLKAFYGKYATADNRCLVMNKVLIACASAGLTTYTIPDGVTSIGEQAFNCCASLTEITIADSVTKIGEYAFWNCKSLQNVYCKSTTPPTGGESMFSGVKVDKEEPLGCNIYIPYESFKEYKSADYWKDYTNYLIPYDFNKGEIVEVEVNNEILYTSTNEAAVEPTATDVFGVNIVSNTYKNGQGLIILDGDLTSIGENAFKDCTTLASITIPKSVKTTKRDAFAGCTALKEVYISDLTAWCKISFKGNAYANPLCNGAKLFLNKKEVTDLIIPSNIKTINFAAFFGCTSLTSVTIPNSVTSIKKCAFDGCSSLTSVTIPDSVTSIGDNAFRNCTSLTSVTIGNGVTSIGDQAFYNCTSLTSVTIGNSVTSIGNFAFYGCTKLTSVTIPDSVTSIGEAAFHRCTSLTSVTIPDSVTSIESQAFYGCTSLTSVTIGKRVTKIGDRAFAGCTSLTSVTIGNGVTSIGNAAFYGCTKLTSVTIPDSVTSIGEYAFCFCDSMTRVDITDLSAWCKISFGDYYANPLNNGAKLYLDGSELTDITIPSDITEIKGCAFSGCKSLTSVTIGNSVTKIGDRAFAGCTSLTSITIPDSVTAIGNAAFYGCTKLTSVTIPDSVTAIGDYTFYNCTSLTSVTIPDSVTSIGQEAFLECTSLKEVYCKPTTPPTGGWRMFSYSDNESKPIGCKIYVPTESVEAYIAATYWKDYADYIVSYDFEKGEIVTPIVKEVVLEATQIQSLIGNGYYLADGTQQDVTNEATWLKWTAGSLDFEACRVLYHAYTDKPVYNGCFQFQGDASNVAKQGFLGNATSNGEIKQVIIEAYSAYATPSFNVYYGDAKLPKDSAKVLNVVDHCVKGERKGMDGSYDVYSFTCTFDIPAGNEFFAVRNDSKGATYIKSITVKY